MDASMRPGGGPTGAHAATQLLHNAQLDIYEQGHLALRANKIVCTIGPKTQSVEALKMLIAAGMNVARMNFSHGTHEYHQETINNVRQACKETGATVAIALDTKGPEIRTGLFKDPNGVKFGVGDKVLVSCDPQYAETGDKERFYVDYTNICKVIKQGNHIFIDDGVLDLLVENVVDDKTLACSVCNPHVLTNRKGVNLPNVDVDLPAVSAKDESDLKFGADNNVDFVFASFIRSADQVHRVRKCVTVEGKKHVPLIISKIENHQGVNNIDSILEATDGIMVARGDLGVEIPAEKVIVAQKMLIAKCNIAGKPVICATQMLESMTYNPRPTRAEVSDVANAVLDGADCVMLSGETAKGSYPKEVVDYMVKICMQAQLARRPEIDFNNIKAAQKFPMPVEESICSAGVFCAFEVNAKAIIVLSNTGRSARLVSKFRPTAPIICVSEVPEVCRAMAVQRNVFPVYYDRATLGVDLDRERRVKWGMRHAVEVLKTVKPGDTVFAVHADVHMKGFANQTRVLVVPQNLDLDAPSSPTTA